MPPAVISFPTTTEPYSEGFIWLLILINLLAVQYAFNMYAFVMKARLAAFTTEFMSKFKD